MGRVILCNRKKADTPLYISRSNINIYTIEELAYYILNNMYIIDDGIINNNTFLWIKEELDLPGLAELLEDEGKSIQQQVMTILNFTGYLSDEDITNAKNLLNEIEGQPIIKRKMIKAQYLLKNHRYKESINLYKLILEICDNADREIIYNNIATAYASLFLYEKAAEYYIKAYKINNNPQIYREILNVLCFYGDKKKIDETLKNLKISDLEYEKAKKNIAVILEKNDGKNYNRLMQALKLKEDTAVPMYYEEIEKILKDWKKDYIHYSEY